MQINNFISLFLVGLAMIGCTSGGNNSTPTSAYQFVVDAGSSGSRIYIYNKLQTESGLLINDLYESKINTPLASFANNPENAGSQGIQPLLTSAINFMHTTKSTVNLATIPTSVLGTAGMRLITESEQAAIYQNVAATIINNDLQLQETKTISGQYEGLYSWADVNYLQKNFNTNTDTNGIFEVGGASAQIAFATTQAMSESIIPALINNKLYTVYSISFLGLGQDIARSSMNQLSDHNGCYPRGYTSVPLDINGNFNYNICTTNYSSITALYPEIKQVKNVQSFLAESFIGISSVYYVLHFWNIENQPELLSQDIKNTCIESFNQITAEYPNAYKAENQCANSVFINDMIFNDLTMKANQLTAVEAINGTALTWTLGYVLIQK